LNKIHSSTNSALPSSIIIDENGAWFSYSFLGVVVQTDKFYDLSTNCNFSSVTDSFRVRGSLDEVKTYLKKLPPLAVYLAANSSILASASVPLSPLISSVNFSGKSELSGKWSINKDQTQISKVSERAHTDGYLNY
tara:strand:+ start:70 stop:477 length:408 start_codon:yes stop_codon:yes gene_type:complete